MKDFKFLYYQRQLVKGFFALPTPTIFAVRSPVGDGYIYLRKRIDTLRIRDFDNGFLRSVDTGAPIGVRKVPVRGIGDGLSVEAQLHGRPGTQTWVFTKEDLPRLVNEETFTEFIACIPLKTREDPIVGKYTLISDYYERFIDVYRLISGDAAVAHFDSGLSFMPFTGEAMVEVAEHVTETFDEIVVNYYPRNFDHRMFQLDVDYTESGSVNAYHDEMQRAERVGHYLATGLEVNAFHRRVSDLMAVAQQARDHTLLALSAFPVFETYYNGYIAEVRRVVPEFNAFVSRKEKRAGDNPIHIGTKLEWLPAALSALGFDTSSVEEYFRGIAEANRLRQETVHEGKRINAEEAGRFLHRLTMCVNLCETSLGRANVFISPLRLKAG